MKKVKKWWIGAAIGLLVLGAGVCIYERPEIRLLMSLQNLQKQMDTAQKPLLSELSLTDYYKNRQENVYHDTFDITISSPYLESEKLSGDTYTMKQITAAYDGIYHNREKEMRADIGVGIMGINLLHGKMYVQDDKAYMTIPNLFSGCYYVELSTLGKDFNDSELAADLQVSLPENLSIRAFTDGNMTDWEMLQEMKQSVVEHGKTLKSYVTLENGEKTEKGRPVVITLDDYAVNDMMHYIERVCLHSDLYQNQADHLFADASHRAFLESIFQAEYTEDVTIHCYLDAKRHLKELELVSPIAVSEKEKLSLSLKLQGKENAFSDIVVSAAFARTGVPKETYELERVLAQTGQGNVQTIRMTQNQEERLNVSEVWEKDSKNYQMKASVSTEEKNREISLKGTFRFLTPGESAAFEIADFCVKENGEELFRAAGEVVTDANENKTVAIHEMDTEHAKALLDMSRAELFGLLYEGVKNMGKSFLSENGLRGILKNLQ